MLGRHVSPGAKVLKGAAPIPARLVPAAVHDADRRVREMIARAEEEARGIAAAAEASRARLVAEAAEEGHREGLARAAATLAAAGRERDRCLAAAEREVVALALAVARKVLGRELAYGAAVADLAARALEEARARREVLLRVNPADAAAVREAEGRLAAILLRAPLAVREDPAVPPGGAVVETEAGCVDASVDTQLALLARALDEASP
jgi:flagellar biosynthesis/type III secretory pathway protein FliH